MVIIYRLVPLCVCRNILSGGDPTGWLACPGTPCPLAHFRQDWAEPDRVVLIPTGSCKDRSRGKG